MEACSQATQIGVPINYSLECRDSWIFNADDGFRRIFVISALLFIAFGVALAALVIYAIWSESADRITSKAIGTLSVLFLLTGFLHLVAKGACEKGNGKS